MKLTLVRDGNKRQETWKRWFAWFPVFAETADSIPNGHFAYNGIKFIWLENVERKEYIGYGGWSWRHREIA